MRRGSRRGSRHDSTRVCSGVGHAPKRLWSLPRARTQTVVHFHRHPASAQHCPGSERECRPTTGECSRHSCRSTPLRAASHPPPGTRLLATTELRGEASAPLSLMVARATQHTREARTYAHAWGASFVGPASGRVCHIFSPKLWLRGLLPKADGREECHGVKGLNPGCDTDVADNHLRCCSAI